MIYDWIRHFIITIDKSMEVEEIGFGLEADKPMPHEESSLLIMAGSENDPVHKESGCSSMIKLDAEASEGESLDSGVFRAVLE